MARTPRGCGPLGGLRRDRLPLAAGRLRLGLRGDGRLLDRFGGGQELDVPDHLVVVALLATLALPLAELQPAIDRDQPALAQVLGGGLSGLSEDADVDVADLSATAHPVDRQAQ